MGGNVQDDTSIPDMGCSHHMGNLCTPGTNKRITDNGPAVRIPNGTIMTATHECELPIPQLLQEAQHTNLYPEISMALWFPLASFTMT
eukprot:6844574-Ditylum_brightwellii.AAC.1